MIKLDLTETYNIEAAKLYLPISVVQFDAPQRDGELIRMYVTLTPYSDKYLVDVYNLCLGPRGGNGEIDDKIRLKHKDPNKVLSTAILIAYTFLIENPTLTIGLDGSSDIRANLYHAMFVLNGEKMSKYFISVGVDWYVKLLRNKLDIERDEYMNPIFKPRIEPFDYSRSRHELYGYYMLHLKQ